jgi:Tol biopolymer transport system component
MPKFGSILLSQYFTLQYSISRLSFYLLLLLSNTVWGQGMYTPFGQSKVQYGKFEWSFVRSENFDAYHYPGGRELAQFAARTCENELNSVEQTIDHRLSGRVEIIVYNTLSDYKQTNLNVLSDQSQNPGGYAQVVSNKIFVYFNGSHEDFVRQLRSGLSLVLINELLFGGSIQDRIQTAALLNLPDWYLFGLTAYIGKSWDIENNNKMKDIILKKKTKKFNRLIQNNPQLAGQAFWYYLIEKFGIEVVANMLYVSRLSRNYESALIYVTGDDLKKTTKDLMKYYQVQYSKEDTFRNLPINQFKIKKRLIPYVEPQLKVSSRGDKLIFTTNKYGKYKIWLMDTKTGKHKKVHKGGFKYHMFELDHSFPMTAWHPGGEKFSFIIEKKGKLYMTTVDLINKKKETIQFFKFDKINSFAYSDNERTLVFSATRKGQSDLYVYDLNTRRERQLTNDSHDDLYPRFVDGSSKIIFSSNRNSNLVGAPAGPTLQDGNNLDIYLYDFENSDPKLVRLTNTPNINETEPIEYNNNYFGYLTEFNGIKNRYVARYEQEYDYTELTILYKDEERPSDTLYVDELKNLGNTFEYEGKQILLDSSVAKIDTIVHQKTIVFTYPLTNYKRNIITHDVSKQSKIVYETIYADGKYVISYSPLVKHIEEEATRIETYPTMYRLKSGFASKPFTQGAITYSSRKKTQLKQDGTIPIVATAPRTYDYFFVSEFTPKTQTNEDNILIEPTSKIASAKGFKLAAPRFYNVTYFPDYFVTQLDNSIINTYYQPIGLSDPFSQPIQPMIKFGVVDLLEDYRITGGFRFPFNLNTIDYFASFETLKKRFDHKISLYRQSREVSLVENPSNIAKNLSHEIRYAARFPFNPIFCIRTELFVRQDRTIIKGINQATLELPNQLKNWAGGKVELVFDNTIPKGLNLYNGTKFKVFYEHYEQLKDKKGQLNTVGFDFRHFQKLHRQLIFAFRTTFNTSFGPAKVRYTLGGVDNWVFATQEESGNSPNTVNYAFQALATNLRGFNQNIRSGNSFAVINNEIRWPIFTYLINRPIRSEFISNFQVVPFFDIGTAWVGPDPYSEENTFNQRTVIENSYISATVINVRDPIVAGYGGGLRSKLLGYFMRFDMAWGIQDAEVADKPIYYFSLSLDF